MKNKLLKAKKKLLLLALTSGMVMTSSTGCMFGEEEKIIYSYRVYEKQRNEKGMLVWALVDDNYETYEIIPEYKNNKKYELFMEVWDPTIELEEKEL